MEFEEPQNQDFEMNAGISQVEIEQGARNAAVTEAGEERVKAFQEELSETAAGKIERFGVGPNSKGALAQAAQKLNTANHFHMAAIAHNYSQSVTFNVGGRGVQMSLGDMRDIASDRYNHHANQLRTLKSQGASQDKIRTAQKRMNAFGDLMRLTDDVAHGKASPQDISAHIEKHNLGEEIVDHATSDPDIHVNYTSEQTLETAQAGSYANQTATERNADLIESIFGSP